MNDRNHKEGSTGDTSRRKFLGKAAAALAATSVAANLHASEEQKPVKKVTTRVLGANDRINLAFIGNGMQFLGLLQRGFQPRKDRQGDFEYAAMCDVWEPRLKNAQQKTKTEKTYRDYRDVLARSDIDGVVIAVPDHWHYGIARDALLSGKDVYLEKPMTYTIEEAARLNELVGQTTRILQVGGSGPTTRLYWKVNEFIRAGKMGKVLWGLIGYNRNTDTGMWDYPIPGVGDEAWPGAEFSEKNCDWKMWLGPAPSRRLSAERYFRWRKYWDYSGGNATDLLYHRLGGMSTMLGFDFPARVVGAGGIYVQKNREVPDTYMTMVEYPGDYCVNMISCMGNEESAPVSIHGNWATLQIVRHSVPTGESGQAPNEPGGGRTSREVAIVKAETTFLKQFQEANEGKTEVTIEPEKNEDLADNWLNCMRSRETPAYDVLKGYKVMVAIRLGVDSYRQGKVMIFDAAAHRVVTKAPQRKVYLPPEA